MPSEEQLEEYNEEKKARPQKGLAYIGSAGTIGMMHHLSRDEKYAVNIIISIIIVCGWLAFGWIMQKMKKVYVDKE